MSRIVRFYLHDGPNTDGRTLGEILCYSDHELEHSHDVIQWLFPTKSESAFNPDAPRLTRRDVRLWRGDPRLRANLMETLERFLAFLGLGREGDRIIQKVWKVRLWNGLNHNWLRISRALDSLSTLGLRGESHHFLDCLKRLRESNRNGITDEAMACWTMAAKAGDWNRPRAADNIDIN